MARRHCRCAGRALRLTSALARRTGMPGGICAGQGWESEAKVDLAAYPVELSPCRDLVNDYIGAEAARIDRDARCVLERAHRIRIH